MFFFFFAALIKNIQLLTAKPQGQKKQEKKHNYFILSNGS